MTRVAVIGLGKLGACMAACMAHKGFEVVGVDVNHRAVEAINAGEAPVQEPGLSEMIAGNHRRLQATQDYSEALAESEMSFIVVPTPSEDHGGFSLRYAEEAARSIGRTLKDRGGYHLVVLTSTVLPGSTEYRVKTVLEEESGKSCGRDFGLCYNPEFIALGDVIRGFLNPDFVLIGESDERAGELLANLYKDVCDNDPPVARMNYVNAELTKIAVNTFVTTKITFANMLGALSEQLPGGDVDVVTAALGLDSRIGSRYLKGGLGYGGPCFPRDNKALAFLGRHLALRATLAESTDRLNRELAERLLAKVRLHTRPGGTVAVLGLSYKPDSNVIEESQGIYLSSRLADAGDSVVVYDPLAMENARGVLHDRVSYANNLREALAHADAAVVVNPDPAFLSLRPTDLPQRGQPLVLIDCWRVLSDPFSGAGNVEYLPLGVGNNSSDLSIRLAEIWRGGEQTGERGVPASLQETAGP